MRHPVACLLLLTALSACNSKTEDRFKALDDRLDRMEKLIGRYDAATLKPGMTGYSLLATDIGRIAVAVADVQPFANGTRVLLDFGNPTSARLTGMKARIEWGANDSRGLPMIGGSVQSLAFTAPEPLPPGSWRQYKVDLPGIPPTQLGWIRVSAFDSGTVDLLSQ
jgi:hypothetical protein